MWTNLKKTITHKSWWVESQKFEAFFMKMWSKLEWSDDSIMASIDIHTTCSILWLCYCSKLTFFTTQKIRYIYSVHLIHIFSVLSIFDWFTIYFKMHLFCYYWCFIYLNLVAKYIRICSWWYFNNVVAKIQLHHSLCVLHIKM